MNGQESSSIINQIVDLVGEIDAAEQEWEETERESVRDGGRRRAVSSLLGLR